MLPLMEEILHQFIGSLSHYLQGLLHPRWCRISFTNSIMYIVHIIGKSSTYQIIGYMVGKPLGWGVP